VPIYLEPRDVTADLEQFQSVFGSDATTDAVAKAIGAFERTVNSGNAPYDKHKAGDSKALSPAAQRGMRVFFNRARCSACHAGPNLTDGGFHNIGVDTVDVGRYNVLPLASQKFAFKTPGLRDIEYSAPYLHNGSAKTLREVVELYNEGGYAAARHLGNIGIEPLGLTDQEIDDLVVFMKALSGQGAHDYPIPSLP